MFSMRVKEASVWTAAADLHKRQELQSTGATIGPAARHAFQTEQVAIVRSEAKRLQLA